MNIFNLILFDGECNLCNSAVDFVIKHDKNNMFKFASLQSTKGQQLLKELDFSTTNFETFILIKNNKCFIKSTAALHVAKELCGVYKYLYYFIFIPRLFRDFIYTIIAKNRYLIFGKKNTCRVPNKNEREKFII